MRRLLLSLMALVVLSAAYAPSAHAKVDVNVNVGLPLPPLPQIVLPAPPEFILPPALGFYVAVDVPYDIFLVRGNYYLYRDNAWYRARHYNGPWRSVEYRYLPPGLRKHSYDRIRYYRDAEYKAWNHDRRHYKGRYFKPGKDWKKRSEVRQDRREDRRDMRQEYREDRRDMRQDRREDRREMRDERRDDRRERREDRQDDRR